jgi:hypothetical protein
MFDLATAKTRLNISGTAQDAMLTAAVGAALAVAEKYCDRLFMYAAETVKFYDFRGHVIFLPRYPIVAVISETGLPTTRHVNGLLGAIELHGRHFIDEAVISYAGGYQVLPADLELALWLIFDGLWPQFNLPVSAGAAVSPGSVGAIASISVPDVGTLRFDNGGSSSNSGGSGAAVGFIPATAVSLLEPYRRRLC